MKVFGELYAKCYDLLYRDKDYAAEVEYVSGLIEKYNPGAETLLDFGCGSGRHDVLFAGKNYNVTGIDRSPEMVDEANKAASGNPRLQFQQGDITDLDLGKKFDVVVSLFHVFSYLTTNADLKNAMASAYKHLKPGGILIFDYWYGPAVLNLRPTVKVKKLADDHVSIVRIAEPDLYENENFVDVNFTMFVQEKSGKEFNQLFESHRMRYLFLPEIELLVESAGFELLNSLEFLTLTPPSQDAWNSITIVRKGPDEL